MPGQIVRRGWNFLNMFCVIIPVFRMTFLPVVRGDGGFLNGLRDFFGAAKFTIDSNVKIFITVKFFIVQGVF
jgi:hypothetical protein